MPYKSKVMHARGESDTARVRALSTLDRSTTRLGRLVSDNITSHLMSFKCSSIFTGAG